MTATAAAIPTATTTPGVLTLRLVEDAVRQSWAADTCSPDDVERAPWQESNPSYGHCDVTALVVQDLLGGDLVLAEVHRRGQQEGYHWWNVLSPGVEVDLTREQFRDGQVLSAARVVVRPRGPLPRRVEAYRALRDRVAARLGLEIPDPYGSLASDGEH